jgi:hypothetical protein
MVEMGTEFERMGLLDPNVSWYFGRRGCPILSLVGVCVG